MNTQLSRDQRFKANGVTIRIDWIDKGWVGFCKWRDGDPKGELGKMPVESFMRAVEKNAATEVSSNG